MPIKNLIIIIGPSAVGKMTVGRALSQATGYKLLHNHISIEVAFKFFDFGTNGFRHISESIRSAVFDAVLDSELQGLIFTYMWAFDEDDDCKYIAELVTKWEKDKTGKVYFLELCATEKIKKERNKHEDRIKAKPSKKDIEKSENLRLKFESTHRLNSLGRFPLSNQHICIDNSSMEPIDVANHFLSEFKLE